MEFSSLKRQERLLMSGQKKVKLIQIGNKALVIRRRMVSFKIRKLRKNLGRKGK